MENTSAAFLLDTLITSAVDNACSDVHITIHEEEIKVWFRLKGQLVPYFESQREPQALLRRLKALARMNVAEHRMPQEGTFQYTVNGEHVGIRVSIVPIATGTSAVLRILPRSNLAGGLAALGMPASCIRRIEVLCSRGAGLLLVAGATGSGKTTTVYTLLEQLADKGYRVVSIEDPVEIPHTQFVQLEVKEDIGLDFAWGLRALLRQDPDIIMVGEIRDGETARIVLNAALTGHFVISTTHGSDVVSAFARLVELGVPRPLLADVFRAVLMQNYGAHRTNQRQAFDAPFPLPTVNDPFVAFELLEMTPELQKLLISNLPWSAVREHLNNSIQLSVSKDLRRYGG